MFLVAYSAKSKTITQEMMNESGLCPMECHSLEYDGFKYSFVKLYRRAREGQIKAFMLHAINKYGVEQDGEEEMLSNGNKPIILGEKKSNALVVHPVLQIIKSKLSNPASSAEVETWKDDEGGPVLSKTRLAKQFRTVEDDALHAKELRAAKRTIKSIESENIQLASENDDLIEQCQKLKEENKNLNKRCRKLEERCETLEDLSEELKKKLRDNRPLTSNPDDSP